MSIVPNLDEMTDEQKLAVLESVQKSIAESKEIQKRKIGENVELVVQALKKIESDIQNRFDAVGNTIEKRVASIKDGRDGANGKDGRDGKDGKSGRDGLKGDKGVDGQAGRDGVDGVDGVSVVNANIDFDGSLIISLSDGREINVGEVVSADVAEKIKVISTMSTNGAVGIKDEGTSISTGVKNINFVGAAVTATNSGDDVTVTVSGGGSGTVTSVAALTLGTSGTDLSSTVATSTTTPVITLNVPTASATNRGALSSADWTTFNNKGSGTVTSVTGTSPVVSSGGVTPAISLASGYGDTLNPYASKTANFVLAAPNGSAGVPTFRAVVAADIPTLNQSTTGSAATLTTPRAIYGNNFDGSAALTQIIASTYGGTGNGFTKFTGATTAERTYTLPDASSTIVVQGGALGTPSSGTVTNLTGTASININGTVGATTASSGAFTTLSATGVTTVQAGTAALPAITTSGDTNTGIFFPAADTIAFAEGGAEVARFDSSGNFGIGTVSPSVKLDVVGSSTILKNGGTGTTAGLMLNGGGASTTFNIDFGTPVSNRLWMRQAYSDGAGTIKFQYSSDGTMASPIDILSVIFGTGIAVTGLVDISAATSGQIKFPATQNASSDANTLDDYEEGTWTPSVGGTATYTTQAGTYTKIGRLVHVRFILTINVIGTGSQLVISGLPFTETTGQQQPGSMGYFASLAASVVFIAPYVTGSGTGIAFNILTAAGATATNNPNILQSATQVNCSAVYTTS